MEYNEDDDSYYYPCPCGDRFKISVDELIDGEDIAICPSCSLRIRVIYDRLVRFYEKYNKDKISTVKKTLLKYKGDENTLFSYLVEKYGREPGTIDPKDEL